MSGIEHSNALAPGHRLHWYRIDSVLSQNQHGITYLAFDTLLRQQASVREFFPAAQAVRSDDGGVTPSCLDGSDVFRSGLNHFLAQGQVLVHVRHHSIVHVFSVFEAGGTAYMVMEHEQGVRLDDAVKRLLIAGEAGLLTILYELIDGLQLLHDAGLVHGDITLANILLREDGLPLLQNFDLAQFLCASRNGAPASAGLNAGHAPRGIAGEMGNARGPWTDVYALGACAFEVISSQALPGHAAPAAALLGGERDPYTSTRASEPPVYSAQLLAAIDAALAMTVGERLCTLSDWTALLPPRPIILSAVSDATAHSACVGYNATREQQLSVRDPSRARSRPASPSTHRHLLFLTLFVGTLMFYLAVAGGFLPSPFFSLQTASVTFFPATKSKPGTGPAIDRSDESLTAPRDTDLATRGDDMQMLDVQQARESTALERVHQRFIDGGTKPARIVLSPIADSAAARDPAEDERVVGVPRLHALAEKDLAAQRLSVPHGNNALERYRRILALAPDDAAARAGLERIAERYLELAAKGLRDNQADWAALMLRRAAAADPDNPRVVAAQRALDLRRFGGGVPEVEVRDLSRRDAD